MSEFRLKKRRRVGSGSDISINLRRTTSRITININNSGTESSAAPPEVNVSKCRLLSLPDEVLQTVAKFLLGDYKHYRQFEVDPSYCNHYADLPVWPLCDALGAYRVLLSKRGLTAEKKNVDNLIRSVLQPIFKLESPFCIADLAQPSKATKIREGINDDWDEMLNIDYSDDEVPKWNAWLRLIIPRKGFWEALLSEMLQREWEAQRNGGELAKILSGHPALDYESLRGGHELLEKLAVVARSIESEYPPDQRGLSIFQLIVHTVVSQVITACIDHLEKDCSTRTALLILWMTFDILRPIRHHLPEFAAEMTASILNHRRLSMKLWRGIHNNLEAYQKLYAGCPRWMQEFKWCCAGLWEFVGVDQMDTAVLLRGVNDVNLWRFRSLLRWVDSQEDAQAVGDIVLGRWELEDDEDEHSDSDLSESDD